MGRVLLPIQYVQNNKNIMVENKNIKYCRYLRANKMLKIHFHNTT
jgi:hypothetical protein